MEVEKANTAIIITSALATAVGIVFVLAKMYSYIGLILLFFGGFILMHSLAARKKEIISDELTEWIAGKSANLSFWATLSTIVLLLAVDIYKPNFFETFVALGIVYIAAVGTRLAGEYYYGKINKNIGF